MNDPDPPGGPPMDPVWEQFYAQGGTSPSVHTPVQDFARRPKPRRRMFQRLTGSITAWALILVFLGGFGWAILKREVANSDPHSYAFIATQAGSTLPVSYNPCKPIGYVVNPEGAPSDWESLVTEALTAITEASGFEFSDLGTTDKRAFDRERTAWNGSPVRIGWATPEELPELKGNVAGLGGSAYRDFNGFREYISGSVAFDRDTFATASRDERLALIQHEFGHVLGLDHVDDVGQLMHPEAGFRDTLGEGDVQGLRILHAGQCRP